MPNTPLQTFRAVEPANYGFGAAATLASTPFVLYHLRGSQVTASNSTTTIVTAISFGGGVDLASRMQPWTVRTQNNHYPVKVPEAYDRIYIFPMWVLDTTDGLSGTAAEVAAGTATKVPVTWSVAAPGTNYAAGMVMPYGMFPQTRDYGNTIGAVGTGLAQRRLPLDVIKKFNPSASTVPNLQTTGIWQPLYPYASNYAGSNGLATSGGSFATPVATPRSTASSGSGPGIGAPYQLPPDLSVGFSVTSTLSNTASGYTATSTSGVFCGAGVEFSTMGCEEVVASLITAPANAPAITLDANLVDGDGATLGKAAQNFFLMGVLLG